jgi:hypothetical protein
MVIGGVHWMAVFSIGVGRARDFMTLLITATTLQRGSFMEWLSDTLHGVMKMERISTYALAVCE